MTDHPDGILPHWVRFEALHPTVRADETEYCNAWVLKGAADAGEASTAITQPAEKEPEV